ncbi:hypothetical protein J2N67_006553 (plasmid) [Bacillus thuringiensis]|nr:hypothetical protein B4158_5758 [Bacillus cereus]USP56304.1 hypothetical protein J2N67_006553 [Bacillus thuringiensis]
MVKEWYSLGEAADKLGISHTSVSRYIQTYPDFFKTRSVGRKKLISNEGLPLLVKIKELYADGVQKAEILDQLQGSIPVYHENSDVEEVVFDANIATIEPLLRNLETMVQQQNKLYEQNSLLVEQVQKADQRTEILHEQLQKSDKRNQELQDQLTNLTDKMSRFLETQEASATTDKQPWYKRILK